MCIVIIQHLVHILKAKREPPTLRLKKLIENLSEYKFDIYFLKGEGCIYQIFYLGILMMKIHLMRLYQLLYAARVETEISRSFAILKEEVDALPEQDNYIPYQEDDFMFLFSDDKHVNVSLISELTVLKARIEGLKVCVNKRKRQLHDILNIMTRSMSKAKQADVPAIYPLLNIRNHVKPDECMRTNLPVQAIGQILMEIPAIEEYAMTVPKKCIQGEATYLPKDQYLDESR